MPSRARLTIDLAAVSDNWRSLRDRAAHGRCAGVVKADGYGLGADRVGKALKEAGCRQFFVAQTDEAVALRRALPEAEIFVLGGLLAEDLPEFQEFSLTPVLNDPGQVLLWLAAGNGRPAALHVDTGMNRLGLRMREMLDLLEDPAIRQGPWRLLLSHLACADEPDHPLNDRQRADFSLLRARLPQVPASLANSSGIFLGEGWHGDLLRPGIALYGGNPTPGRPNPMKPTVRVQVPVLQVRQADAGETVGYAAAHVTTRPTRIATVSYGYADGYIRAASGKGAGWLDGHKLPVLGRISMDLMTLDATDVPEGLLHPGTLIDLIGPDRSLDEAAADAGTIPYELLTNLGRRAERIYRV